MKGNRNWIGSSRLLMALSIIAGLIGVLIICGQISKIMHLDGSSTFATFLIGVLFVLAIHSFWGLMIGMADNIATITDILSQCDIKTPEPISARNIPTPQLRIQPQTTKKPFIVDIEYDDGTWECGSCRQLNDSSCEFCTNCGKSKGKLKVQPLDK